ncbi:Crp/Fnr family transcriptional regulator [Amycolatopsis magusensis]|uniref:Crp/Fnr family transcriptional regulator n=1 Tax=Amycolatopsis magusensis TaxID=882444 RepID=UPI001AE540B6|nr:Crp/Fnr family transcriptional regulator [Amycolatopsis magusensis]
MLTGDGRFVVGSPRTTFPQGSFLSGLSQGPQEALLAMGTAREFEPDRVLFREGESTNHAFLLVDGCVKVTGTTPEGHLALLAVRVGGDLVGELAAMDGQPRVATVTTAGRVRARFLSQADFRRSLAGFSEIAIAVSSSVGVKLRWATRRRIDFGSREVRIRLARVLAELAGSYGIPSGEHIRIGVSLTQPELAALVGAAEPTVHRALAGLRRENIVETGYRRVCVCDRARLGEVADG